MAMSELHPWKMLTSQEHAQTIQAAVCSVKPQDTLDLAHVIQLLLQCAWVVARPA